MTQVLTAQPQTLLQLLKSAGAQCGVAAPPEGMKTCPTASHCTLAGGNICVVSLDDAAAPRPVTGPVVAVASGLGLVLIGVAIGWVLRRR